MLDLRDRLPVQTDQRLEFWACHEIASLTEEHAGRLRVVRADGAVAHRPGPLPADGPWRKAGQSLVHPALLRDGRDPAGFPFPGQPLEPLPPLTQEPPLPGLGLPAGSVLYLRGASGKAWWHTDQGPIPAGASAEAAASLHPHLVPAGRGTYVNRRRLAAIRADRKRFHLTLDEGTELSLSWGAREPLCKGLGLPQLYHLEPFPEPLYRERLRDWPFALATATAQVLRKHFPDGPRRLIANQIWQAFRYGQNHTPKDYGTDHRGFWYVPLVATLSRAGYLQPGWAEWEPPEDPTHLEDRGPAGLYLLYQEVLGQLIGADALFTFQELGFEDPRPDLRRIGSDLVVVGEKTSLGAYVDRLADEFGVSTLILGGLPALISTEFFARALPVQSVRVIAYVDFDPGGWIAAESFAAQLRRYAIDCTEPAYLVRPERFTPEEIELYAMAIPTPTPQIRGKVRAWLAKSGGIEGKARGLHADHLRPVERVLAAFRELTEEKG